MPASKRHTVVGIGEILWDLLPGGKKLGGAPTNFAYHAGMLGTQAHTASCVGTDALGAEILDLLRSQKLSTKYLQTTSGFATGTVTVKLSADGVPNFTIHENVAWDHIDSTPTLLKLAQNADAVCFGSLAQRCPTSRQTILQFLNATPSQCLRVFDINIRQKFYSEVVIRESLKRARVLKLNEDELPLLGAMLGLKGTATEVLKAIVAEFDLELAALTRGGHGSVMQTAAARSEHPGLKVTVVDTVGSGDAFTAAMVVGLLRGCGLDTVNAAANRLGAYVASQAGGTPPLPDELRQDLFTD
ncbi:MAG: hypothetical protein A3K19_23680 [Lentisphaerae bacterium RIFOXYB12_FULL_65_16]|nr:MAG: hypothetical protein A3K18_18675 [Lentisphaerae bacterium RIFOXYA12_64_32]OGV94111.1 MAG: hypothetical protein A3K19_23680 [Lentisphaerae bacterium RIFOXYB12_FULL_65_16]